jgi:tetratricopeptide (TPR) repeat protein
VLLVSLVLAACGTGRFAKSPTPPAAIAAGTSPDPPAATLQLAEAMKLVAQKDWPRALAALRTIIDAKSFGGLSGDFRYEALSTAGKVAFSHGPPELAYEYLGRVVALPQSNYVDWMERLQAADKLHRIADSIGTLTVLMERWPDRSGEMNPDYILRALSDAERLRHGGAFALLEALYAAHWKLKWDIEPSASWRDLVLFLLENDRFAAANDVAHHVTDTYVLIAMRADRRFDAVVAANPAQFDIEAAAEREFKTRQTAAERTPQSLELEVLVIDSLLRQQRYEAALAASDSVLLDIQSTNYPQKLYEDYDDERPWFLNLRSIALQRVGRWDEAVAQLSAASQLLEKYSGNVDELINLAQLFCDLARPDDALSALGRMVAGTSAFGTMRVEALRANAYHQLGDSKQVEHSLRYLRSHRADLPAAYADALITVNRLDRAADELVAELLDKVERQEALEHVQSYAPTPETPRNMEWDARRRAIIARPEVQAAIQEVGRIEAYSLEEE